MSWNYRIVDTIEQYRRRNPYDRVTKHVYSIREVYYEKNKPVAWTENAVTLEGLETTSELFHTLMLIGESKYKPVLTLIYDNKGCEKLIEKEEES